MHGSQGGWGMETFLSYPTLREALGLLIGSLIQPPDSERRRLNFLVLRGGGLDR